MIAYEGARRLCREAADPARLGVEEVPLAAALGRVTAAPVLGVEPVPPFDNSAMDGWAVAAARAAKVPARLPVLGAIHAGDAPRCQAESGAWKIMTGAPLPAGCDAVVPVENARALDGGRAVELLEAPEPGDFVRGKGRDFPAGGVVCPAGTRLSARHLMALAAVGAARVPVRRRPRAAVIATGRELVAPEFAPAPGQIRDASSTYLAAALPAFGVEPLSLRVVGDDADAFEGELLQALSAGADLIITTGAVSKGDADFVPAVLKRLGFETLFHGVSIRPGKPVLLARAPGGQVIFALPGNPVSTVVGLRFFVDLYLRRLLGRPDESPSRARLAEAVDKPEQLRCFFKSVREFDGAVKVLPGQASFQIHSLVAADCWAVLPEGKKRLLLGEEVDVYPLSEPLA